MNSVFSANAAMVFRDEIEEVLKKSDNSLWADDANGKGQVLIENVLANVKPKHTVKKLSYTTHFNNKFVFKLFEQSKAFDLVFSKNRSNKKH